MRENFKNFIKQINISSIRDREKLNQTLCVMSDCLVKISTLVKEMPLKDLSQFKGEKNPQGEVTQWLDTESNQVIKDAFSGKGECALIVSEEETSSVPAGKTAGQGEYLLAIDPLDGSSNLGVNIPVGTIFGLWQRENPSTPAKESEFFVPGRNLIAAGYSIYGPNTLFVLSILGHVLEFVLDENSKEFILISENLKIPSNGKIYSINEGNYATWGQQTKSFIDYCKGANDSTPLSARYIGSMVADFHRNLKKGGIFIYPADQKNPNGKLRMLYECLPMSFVCENAGGRSSDGSKDILDLIPQSIHQRCPIVIGSRELVDRYDRSR